MKTDHRKLKKRIIALTICIAVLCAILLYMVLANSRYVEVISYFSSLLVQRPLVYFMLMLWGIVLISLLILIIIVIHDIVVLRKSGKKKYRFSMLNAIDDEMQGYISQNINETTLQEFCENFRSFCSYKLGLYYDISVIRRFIAGMGVSHLMILQGMSGTGKTSLAYAFGEYISNESVIVPVQPMWKERSDMVGYFNEFTGRFNETTLLRKMYEAQYTDNIYIVVLDEVNISRIEYYFAEFLSLLEIPDENKRYLEVVTDVWLDDPKKLKDGKILLPANMWFIGTANNDDSTFAISDKVYDRAMIVNLDKKAKPFDGTPVYEKQMSYRYFKKLCIEAGDKYKISESTGNNIRNLDQYLVQVFGITFGNRILSQIESYVSIMVACGGSELDAVDDILAGKILRKLEQLNPTFVQDRINNLKNVIEGLFGEGNMPLCIEYIEERRRLTTYVSTEA